MSARFRAMLLAPAALAMVFASHLPANAGGLIPYQAFMPNERDGPDEPTMAAIDTQAEWQRLWSVIELRVARGASQKEPYPLPPIDFGRYTLIVVALGMKPTGGYEVTIDSIQDLGTRIIVSAIAPEPGPGCLVTLLTTSPMAMALIPRTSKPVQFDITRTSPRC